MQISPARRAAFEILRRVEAEGAYSSALLARADDDLNTKDRALCHELVLGVLRRQLWLDRTIEHFASRKIDSLDLAVVIALRLGLYQLRFLTRIPASAAINEAVNLVKTARVKSATGFVNAVLRRATREPEYDPVASVNEPIEKISIETSHPQWLIERWQNQFGFEETAAMVRANNERAVVAFRFTAKSLRAREGTTAELVYELRSAGAGLIESTIAPGAWRVTTGQDVEPEGAGKDAGAPQARMSALLRQFSDEGLIYFQDEGSQLVAHLFDAHNGERVLDVCAAPGSKSTLMAALAPESEIVACDLYEHRAQTMQRLAAQQQTNQIGFVVHDATDALPFPPRSFDRVLVDAPCSGTGTLRHNPEIRRRLKPADFGELIDKQQSILHHASRVVRSGGILLYSTCSMETDENEGVVTAFLDHHADFEIAPWRLRAEKLTKDGAVRTWPHRDGADGFFAMAFRRVQ
jgi:16S rRNA (cytosine967-C5)-methyltransferase